MRDRSAHAQLQAALGERGVVLGYVRQTDRHHRAVGWFIQMTVADEACECRFCVAARNGRRLYLGFQTRDALQQLGVYNDRHDDGAEP